MATSRVKQPNAPLRFYVDMVFHFEPGCSLPLPMTISAGWRSGRCFSSLMNGFTKTNHTNGGLRRARS
jgi:hypothetical protein